MKLRYKIVVSILALVAIGLTALALILGRTSACGPAPALSGQSTVMKAIVGRCYGSPAVLEFADVAKPTPADDEVLVKIHAAAVNPLDWHYMRGSPYFLRLMSGLGAPKNPRLGVDFAGTIEAVGKDVTRFQPGDEVFGGGNGAFAQYLTIREDRALTIKPDNISFEQAAAVPIAAISALQVLRDKGQLKSGQKVLINGASGGVGTFAVQIAKSFGAQVTGVCSTRNVEMVRSIGADHVFDYTKQDYTKSGEQYDLIIDNVGNRSLLANRAVMKPEGVMVMLGGSTGNWVGPLIGPLKASFLSPFVSQKFLMIMAQLDSEDLAILADLMQAGTVTPVIDRRYPLSEVADAIAYIEEGHARGKVVVYMD
ncbi:MAG: NAD(P)-dependent alcohol dehydrogenase [Halioglobus sp.]